MLTLRQQTRVGSEYTLPGTDAVFDTGVALSGMRFIGTDHVFRFGSQRMEAVSGVLVGLRQLLAEKDLQGCQSALPGVQAVWADRRHEAEVECGGVITMDTDGAVLGLRRCDHRRSRCDAGAPAGSPRYGGLHCQVHRHNRDDDSTSAMAA
ncbi:hypothetical protein ACWEIJ_37465 [Lentzea sp. NPDC004789]